MTIRKKNKIMDEIFIVNSPKRSETLNHEGNRFLVAAVLEQAYSDATSSQKANDYVGARRFINANNKLFCFYCELLEMNPEWVAKKMNERIEEHDQKKYTRFPRNSLHSLKEQPRPIAD